jgi:hypothetical protein
MLFLKSLLFQLILQYKGCMVFNNNQANNTNKPQESQKQNSIIKKIGKKENYYVNESTNKYIR